MRLPLMKMLKSRWSASKSLMGEAGETALRAPASNGSLIMEVECNWKLAVENYLEAYHLPFIHPGFKQLFSAERT